jgi:uncharacterized Zn-binding protein involved in type VI secretion
MSRPFIVLGDRTDHGGAVVGASVMSDTHGKGIARVGDRVTCPLPGHGTTVIVTGDPTMIIDGQPAARHGDKCACGATLISSQAVSTVGAGGGGGGGRSAPAISPLACTSNGAESSSSPASSTVAASSSAASAADASGAHDQRFLLLDEHTGVPLIAQPYVLHLNGQAVRGVTDDSGHTQKIATGAEAQDVEIEIIGEVFHG